MNLPLNKKSQINKYKMVRNTIILNKKNNHPDLFKIVQPSNTDSIWIEQCSDIKSKIEVAHQLSSKKTKFIFKWWEN
jgi:hypothetical protein